MKVNINQLNYKASDVQSNAEQIIKHLQQSHLGQLSVFSEMSLNGWPLNDMVAYNQIYDQMDFWLEKIKLENKSCILGMITKQEEHCFNSLVFVDKGQVKVTATKKNLTSLDYNLSQGSGMQIAQMDGHSFAFGFLQDLQDFLKTKVEVEFIVLCSNNLFDKKDDGALNKNLKHAASQSQTPIIYLNRVGAEGSYIFDGHSLVINQKAEICFEGKVLQQDTQIIDTQFWTPIEERQPMAKPQRIYEACVVGIRDYFHKTGIRKAIVGLSGGIDSALVVVLAVHALGKENVIGVLMPNIYSTTHSVEDAKKSAQILGIPYYIVPIENIFNSSKQALKDILDVNNPDTTEENLQARARMMIIMAFCNKFQAAMLNTSNKSESCVGYGTLYGDDSGAFGPIADLFKQEVYALSKWINRQQEIIPWHSITKAPSAELHPNQKDSDTLPDYQELDTIMSLHLEEKLSLEQIISQGFEPKTVERVLNLFKRNEFKRRQEAPALRLSSTCFTTDFRLPMY